MYCKLYLLTTSLIIGKILIFSLFLQEFLLFLLEILQKVYKSNPSKLAVEKTKVMRYLGDGSDGSVKVVGMVEIVQPVRTLLR